MGRNLGAGWTLRLVWSANLRETLIMSGLATLSSPSKLAFVESCLHWSL